MGGNIMALTKAELRKALIDSVIQSLPSGDHPAEVEDIAGKIVDAFCDISEPKVSIRVARRRSPKQLYENIHINMSSNPTSHSDNLSYTKKPGNIILNWKKLDDVLSIAVGVTNPVTLPLSVWSIMRKLSELATINLTNGQRDVLLILWQYKVGVEIDSETAWEKYEAEQSRLSLTNLNKEQFHQIIDRLIHLGCIDLSNGVVRLKEKGIIIWDN
jgi:hypothetical protein